MNLRPNPGFFGAKRSDTGDQLALVEEWDKIHHENCDQVDRRIVEMEAAFVNLVNRANILKATHAKAGFVEWWSLHKQAESINEKIQENRNLRNRLYDERLACL